MTFNGKPIYIVDIESDGLLDEATKIHCLGLGYEVDGVWQVSTTTDYSDIQKLFETDCIIVGHNIYEYDLPLVQKIIPQTKVEAFFIDTLFLSWMLQDGRSKHSVQSYAQDYGLSKVEVQSHEWDGSNMELMIARVTEDVKLQVKIFLDLWRLIEELYQDDTDLITSYIKYSNFISDVYKEQYKNPFTLDVDKAEEYKKYLEEEIEKRVEVLKQYMPKTPVKAVKNKPKIKYKKDGTLTSHWEKWESFLTFCSLPLDTDHSVEYIRDYKEPNPQSVSQIKDFLFGLGWKPCTFVDSTSVTGEVKQVPQLKDKDKNLVKSIITLIASHPYLKELEDLSIIQHRLGYVKAFLDTQDGGKVKATRSKLTASLRVSHKKPIVNLPGVSAPYGEYVRSLLTCDEGFILCGSDIASLENYVAANYTYKYNPEILDQLNDPEFDSHITMAQFAGLMTEQEVRFYRENKHSDDPEIKKEVGRLHTIRYNAKTVNYSALFGIGATKLSKDLGIRVSEAKKLIEGFWKMNHHIARFRDEDLPLVTTSDGRQWVQAPLTGFYLPCRAEHKKFNIVIQSTGSYIHNMWMAFIRQAGYKLTLSMHDEFVAIIPDTEEERKKIKKITHEAMEKVNKLFNFAAPISVTVQFGKTYADIH